jgi:RNA polymerase sigma-70 factor (ECF subfamily)
LEHLAETKLIEQAKSDPAYFEGIYNAHFSSVFLFIFKRVADKEVAADLTSQVFLNALTNLKRFKYIGAPFSSWLFKIAQNEVNYYYRKTARQRQIVINDEILENLKEESGINLEDMLQQLSRAIQQLKVDAMELIQLRFFEKRSFKEIGEILNLTENNAKVKTYRVLDKLKRIIVDG